MNVSDSSAASNPPPVQSLPALRALLEADWEHWLLALFPEYVSDPLGRPIPFAERHRDFWSWVWALQRGERARPFVAIWPRGGAKSTSTELACVAVGAMKTRAYGLYVCQTQEQADDHVGNVGAMLESPRVDQYYPDLASRMLGKYGTAKGWRRNRLRTAAGFTLDALGLDSAARGVKLDDQRPDFLIFDDIDGEHDSAATTAKKIKTITRKLLPAGSGDMAVLAVQNLVHPDSIFAQLADGRADFLAGRIVSGPHPAVQGLATEQRDGKFVIVGGTPTWEGQNLERCQAMVDDFGLTAFLSECQHEVDAPPGGMFDHLDFRHCEWKDVPDLARVEVWVDPAVTDTDQSDSHGIQADGLAANGDLYRLWSWEARTSPLDSLERALLKAVELKAQVVGVETDQGGETWKTVYETAWKRLVESERVPQDAKKPAFRHEKAGAGHGPKAHRASQMLADYEKGRLVHVLGTHTTLERALKRFPLTKPLDLVDAAFWSWRALRKPRGVIYADSPWSP